jgi:hypothetical protein
MLVNPIKETETNRDGIVHVIKGMKWYWSLSNSLFRESTDDANELSEVRRELENQIVDLYKVLLTYQIKSVASYYRHRRLVFLRDIVKLDDWDGDQKAILDAENRFRQYCEAYTTQQTNSHLEQLVTNQRSEKDQKCLKDLRATDPHLDKVRIEQDKGGLLRHSYHWILENSDFQQWRNDQQCRLLWIKGDPGKGKTMLLCGIVDDLIKSTTDTANVSFFFCQATDARIDNATAVLRGLLYMLVKQQPFLLTHVRKSYDDSGKQLFEGVNAWVALSNIFTNILEDPRLRSTYVIIDALDECTTHLSLLLKLVVQKSSVCSRVKWIVSSRNWPSIEKDLEPAMGKVRLCLELNEKSVSAAITTYIQIKVDELAKRNKYDNITRNAVQRYLSLNANDTFLWVALVCKELAVVSGWKAQKKLTAFPPGLDTLYRRMMDQIGNSEDAELYKRVLAVVSAVYRPVTLDELASFIDMPDGVSGNYEALTEIIELCSSFLSIRGRTIFFVHQSAKDFLLDKVFNEIFPAGKEDVHYTIVLRSL